MTRPILAVALLLTASPCAAPEPVKHRAYEAPPELMTVIKALLDASRMYGVDPKLAFAVAWAESELKPWARSRRSGKVIARGLMQISAQYQDELVVRFLGWHPSAFNWRDPTHSARLGVAYLRYLTDRFGTWAGIAAFNCGSGRLNEWPRHRSLPDETWGYVHKIFGSKVL